jgi:hypothetical protein
MARIDSPHRREREREVEHEEFYETMAASRPATYRTEVVEVVPSGAERAVQLVAGILNTLLALRFVIALFTSDTTNALTAVIFNATNWLVAPMQALFGTPPSGGGGYFDLPALAAIVLVSVIAWLINTLIRESGARRL